MWNAGRDESQAGIKIAKRNINIGYAIDITLMAESEEEPKSVLMSVKDKSEKAGLKLNIEIMAFGPIASWKIEGRKMEPVTDFISFGSKLTADTNYSHEIKRPLTPWNKSFEKSRQCIKKQRHHFVTLLKNTHIINVLLFLQ